MPLLWFSLAFLAGIGLGAFTRLPLSAWLLLAGLSLALALGERFWAGRFARYRILRAKIPLAVGVLLAALFAGALCWQHAQPNWGPSDLAYYNDSGQAELIGWIAADPDRRENAVQLRVRVESITLESTGRVIPVEGVALVRLSPGGNWQYGQRIRLWGKPVTPPSGEDFSYQDYLAQHGVYTYLLYPSTHRLEGTSGSRVMAAIYGLRQAAYRRITTMLPQPEAGLLSGILLGLENDLPESLEKAFQDTGTAHIIAISGFNMSVLCALFVGFFGRFFPRGWTALLAVLAIATYTVLVGANPAVVRAAIMSGLAVFGRLIGRSSAGTTPLAGSAMLMCIFNPWLLWDVSFQLSFTATLGLVWFADPLQSGFERLAAHWLSPKAAHRLAGPVGENVLFTLAAQVTTLPVTLVHFGRLSFSMLLANPLVLPVQPLVMELGGAALLVGSFSTTLGQALSWPLTAYTIRAVEWCARIPGGAVSIGTVSGWFAAGYYLVLGGLMTAKSWLAAVSSRIKPAAVLTGLGLVTLLAWNVALHRPDGRLHLALFDLAGSPAALLTTPGGNQLLLGGAGGANALSSALGREMSLVDRRLDGLLITSTSADDLQSLAGLIERTPADQVFWALPPPDKAAAERLQEAAGRLGALPLALAPGDALQVDEGVKVRVIGSGKSLAAYRLDYGNLCLVWPGDLPPGAVKADGCILVLDADQLRERALVDWQRMRPLAVLVSGQPAQALPQNWLSTAALGRIEVVSDGGQMWIIAGQR